MVGNASRKVAQTSIVYLTLALIGFASVIPVRAFDKKDKLTGTPVIWEDRGSPAGKDLFYGRGSEERSPKAPFTFIEEDSSGSNPKFDVTDANGVKWKVKLGNEAQPETAVSRLLWSVGYFTDEDYYLPEFTVLGLKKLSRGGHYVHDGVVTGGRFKRANKGEKSVDTWKWYKNPFIGTKEFQGLKVMMMIVNNWDIKDVNNKIISVEGENGGQQLRYEVSDLGATLGQTGGFFSRSRNKSEDFVKTKFVEEAKRPFIKFDYRGKQQDLFDDITISQARWVGEMLSQLSDQQLADAFRAASYSPEESQQLIAALKTRITELATLPQ
jgi:hypothetical protein